jgi:hypothetical protein
MLHIPNSTAIVGMAIYDHSTSRGVRWHCWISSGVGGGINQGDMVLYRARQDLESHNTGHKWGPRVHFSGNRAVGRREGWRRVLQSLPLRGTPQSLFQSALVMGLSVFKSAGGKGLQLITCLFAVGPMHGQASRRQRAANQKSQIASPKSILLQHVAHHDWSAMDA